MMIVVVVYVVLGRPAHESMCILKQCHLVLQYRRDAHSFSVVTMQDIWENIFYSFFVSDYLYRQNRRLIMTIILLTIEISSPVSDTDSCPTKEGWLASGPPPAEEQIPRSSLVEEEEEVCSAGMIGAKASALETIERRKKKGGVGGWIKGDKESSGLLTPAQVSATEGCVCVHFKV